MSKENVIKLLNQGVADFHVFGIKLHNYHWNVKGMQFFSIHELTENYYDYFFALFDDYAERVLQLEAKPPATVKEYLEQSTISEEPGNDFTPDQVVKGVQADFEQLLASARALSEAAGECNDIPTQNMADDHIQWLEKAIWMLRSSQK